MKDEIKEMLQEIKETVDDYLKIYKLEDDMMYDTINYKASQWYALLDYISNLQEENERLKNGYCELKVKCNNGECDCTNEEYEGMVQANMRGSLLLDNYKSKCEKLELENKILKEQMVAMVQPNYVYGIELQGVGKDE